MVHFDGVDILGYERERTSQFEENLHLSDIITVDTFRCVEMSGYCCISDPQGSRRHEVGYWSTHGEAKDWRGH